MSCQHIMRPDINTWYDYGSLPIARTHGFIHLESWWSYPDVFGKLTEWSRDDKDISKNESGLLTSQLVHSQSLPSLSTFAACFFSVFRIGVTALARMFWFCSSSTSPKTQTKKKKRIAVTTRRLYGVGLVLVLSCPSTLGNSPLGYQHLEMFFQSAYHHAFPDLALSNLFLSVFHFKSYACCCSYFFFFFSLL